ncbi:MAG: diacylglycerol kinase family protein [Nanoarchaeota archaeon]|nr:diacylglycerol kinase family protein [Nanoarchaeota archaeon]
MNKGNILVIGKYNKRKEVEHLLALRGISYFSIDHIAENEENIRIKINQGCRQILICGGDGTINESVNYLMCFPKEIRRKIGIGIIPCGRANDFARELNIPEEAGLALERIFNKRVKFVDLIKVNHKYMVSGGGFGLPAEVILSMEGSPKKDKLFSSLLGGFVYSLFVTNLILFGYEGIKIKRKNYSILGILNQGNIGKKFNLSPNSKNDDGYFEVCFVEGPSGVFKDIKNLKKIVAGNYFKGKKNRIDKIKKIKLSFDKENYFMGDGEILCKDKDFSISIAPKELGFFH